MHLKFLSSKFGRITALVGLMLGTLLILYLVWAFHAASTRYNDAVVLAERYAHTTVGKEGYEYIFEPNTQILIDRVKPQKWQIIFYVFLKDYLPFQSGLECIFPDQGMCNWIDIHLFYGNDPIPLF